MKKDTLHHKFRLLAKIIGTVILVSCSFLGAETVSAEEDIPACYLTEDQLEKLYTCKEEVINDTCLEISVEDAEMLMKIAVAEDYTDAISQAYIMSIILNRLNSPDFPNSVKEVIEEKGQFMKLTDERYINAIPDVNSHYALAMIESRVIETDFLFYEATWVKGSWASKHREVALVYGGSRFYK